MVRANPPVLVRGSIADAVVGDDVEIVADRGYEGLVTTGEWESACRLMETEFRAGRYKEGALAGIHAVSTLIERHFPPERRDVNELPDRPVIL